MLRKSIADHVSLSSISIVKEQTIETVPVVCFWLTTARGSPGLPGLSLEFKETPSGRTVRPAVGLAYIFSPLSPVNTRNQESFIFLSPLWPRAGIRCVSKPDYYQYSQSGSSNRTPCGHSRACVTKQP